MRAAGIAVALALAAAWTPGVRAQTGPNINRSIEFEDMGFTSPLTAGARAAAMGGAYGAIGGDISALVHNPAGLARIKRIELGTELYQESIGYRTAFGGTRSSIDTHDGSMSVGGVAVPTPVLRGGFVPAFGVFRSYSSLIDLHYRGSNIEAGTIDDYLLQQTGGMNSYNIGFGINLAPALSAGVTGYVIDGSVRSLSQFDYTFVQSSPLQSTFVSDDLTSEMSGYGGRIGALIYIHPGWTLGLTFTTPTWIRARSSGNVEVVEHVENGIDRFYGSSSSFTSEYLLPFRFEVSGGVEWRALTIVAQVGYADWTEAALDRRRFRNRLLETTFREVIDARLGMEAVLPYFPARIRAGYARIPYPLQFLQADRISADRLTAVHVDDERHSFSCGAGGLVAGVLMLDAAIVRTSGSRSIPSVSISDESLRFLLTAAYRF